MRGEIVNFIRRTAEQFAMQPRTLGTSPGSLVGINMNFEWLSGSRLLTGFWLRNPFDADGQPSFADAPTNFGGVVLRFDGSLRRWVIRFGKVHKEKPAILAYSEGGVLSGGWMLNLFLWEERREMYVAAERRRDEAWTVHRSGSDMIDGTYAEIVKPGPPPAVTVVKPGQPPAGTVGTYPATDQPEKESYMLAGRKVFRKEWPSTAPASHRAVPIYLFFHGASAGWVIAPHLDVREGVFARSSGRRLDMNWCRPAVYSYGLYIYDLYS